ncbi:fumarylacetoacetate hydrolase family protein [Desulfosediminicola flagellatus]|uniref:fumarylacetoacetate hydrolase family protein n=1 Tax=Desulfosediminicola flagellatus TaxID=2569541 RepID=UPI00142EA677|nr:fumarylacetoacetate hydrolase family protein [Desulfosediminicola flagellatus]
MGKQFRADDNGTWALLESESISAIYGVGLSYVKHIEETGSTWDPDAIPPIFKKSISSLNTSEILPYPDRTQFLQAAENLETGLSNLLKIKFPQINPLLDYEVELGIVLLEPYERKRSQDITYMPRLGFVLAGDFTSRSFMVLGEGQADMFSYWGAAKSFNGFSVVGSKMWIPGDFQQNGSLHVQLETYVNGKLRQSGNTSDQVYSPYQMVRFVAEAFPDDPLAAGTVIMSGTPPGVAFQAPGWKRTLAKILGINRMTLMKSVMESNKDNEDFLKPGDIVIYSAGPLGQLSFTVQNASLILR